MKRLEKKHPLAIRWFHWINFPVLFIMIWSGILIYWANDIYRIGIGHWTLFEFFFKHWKFAPEVPGGEPRDFYEKFNLASRLGEGMAWHFVFAWIFTLNGLCYVLYVAFSGEWRELLPKRDTLKQAIQVVLHDLKIRKQPLPRAKFNGAQRIAYTGVILMGLGSLLTGIYIYKPVQASGLIPFSSVIIFGATLYQFARWVHFWLTMAFCGFFLVHVLQVIRAGWNNFRAMITGYEIETVEVAPLPIQPTEAPSHENEPKVVGVGAHHA